MKMNEENKTTCLYIGNLDNSVTEDLLITLFSNFGEVKGCRIIRNQDADPYSFVEFTNYENAFMALASTNKRIFMGKEMKVGWDDSRINRRKDYQIFVSGLAPKIDCKTLKSAFERFGNVSHCKIVKKSESVKSKGYGFVTFVNKAHAESALKHMKTQWLGKTVIHTSWSSREIIPPRDFHRRKVLTYDQIYKQSPQNNTTVYCGGFETEYGNPNAISYKMISKIFFPFGKIKKISCFRNKGYAFIKFATKEAATRAIKKIHNSIIGGNLIRCFWSNEHRDENAASGTHGFPQEWLYAPMNKVYYPLVFPYPGHMGQQYLQESLHNQPYYPYWNGGTSALHV